MCGASKCFKVKKCGQSYEGANKVRALRYLDAFRWKPDIALENLVKSYFVRKFVAPQAGGGVFRVEVRNRYIEVCAE